MNLSFDGMGDQPAQLGGGSHLRTHRDVSTLLVSSILTIKSARAFKLTFDESKSIICHTLRCFEYIKLSYERAEI